VATKIGDAAIKVTADTRDADAALKESFKGWSDDIEKWGKRGALAGAAAVGYFVKTGFDMAASLETANLQFTTLLGSADEAQEHVAKLFEFAAKTPFETGPILEASRHLIIFGGDALAADENLTRIGNSAAALSQPMEEVAFWVGRAYSMIQGGKPFGEAAMRLQEMGVITPQVRDEMERLQASGASADEVFGLLQARMDEFSGAMEAQAGSWAGLRSTIVDNVGILASVGIDPLFDRVKELAATLAEWLQSDDATEWAERVADGVNRVIDGAISLWQNTEDVRVGFVNLVRGGGAIIEFLGKLNRLTDGFTNATGAALIALKALWANPIVGGLALLAQMIGGLTKPTEDWVAILRSAPDEIEENTRKMVEQEIVSRGLATSMQEVGITSEDVVAAIKDQNGEYQELSNRLGPAQSDLYDFITTQRNHRDAALEQVAANDAVIASVTKAKPKWDDYSGALTGIVLDLSAVTAGSEEMGAATDEAGTEATDAIEMMRQASAEKFAAMISSVDDFITGMAEMPDEVEITMEEFEANLTERSAFIAQWFTDLQILLNAGLLNLVREAKEQGPERMGDLIHSYANDLTSAENADALLAAGTEVALLGAKGLVSLEALEGWASAANKNVAGFAEAITANSYAAEAAARKLVRAAQQAAEDEAEAQSPSRLFARTIGLPIAQGIAWGITQGSGSVSSAIEGLISTNGMRIPDLANLSFGAEVSGVAASPGPTSVISVETTGDAEVLAREIAYRLEWMEAVGGRA
jgi:hypothetical protein